MSDMQEYLSSKDVSEARSCLRKLAVPFFHHEVVKQALLRLMQDTQTEESLVTLLKQLSGFDDLSSSQISSATYNKQLLEYRRDPLCECSCVKTLEVLLFALNMA